MSVFHCQKCGADIGLPDNLSEDMQRNVTSVVHRQGRIQGMMWLKDSAGLGLAESKAIVMHISGNDETCHRCTTKLGERGAVACAKCRSLNFNW